MSSRLVWPRRYQEYYISQVVECVCTRHYNLFKSSNDIIDVHVVVAQHVKDQTERTIARVPWPTDKRFDLGCCGCLYCKLKSCVLAVR